MSQLLSKQYDASDVEPAWISEWLEKGYFHADENEAKAPFSITLPPPNVTGSLHMGHALGGTLQDILIRWRRMQGRNAMWMPGQDHAGIATQLVVERMLKKTENTSRHELGREKFLERVWEWKEEYGGRIYNQAKRLGFSLDWERDRFTMDEGASIAVRDVFVKLYEEGLIYRANRLVNWCSDCRTAVSDLEVNNEEENGSFWELKYPVEDSDRQIVVATTRPETMLGDSAVAVHPDDDRYRDLVGKFVVLPLVGRKIPIVADAELADMEKGTGAVKVTPAHSFEDFECGKRQGLEEISVIGRDGTIIAPAPQKYIGMSAAAARKAVVADMDAAGLLGEVTERTVPLGRCDRSKTVIEPLLSEQWWVKTESLAKPAIEAVESGKTTFVPDHWSKTYMHWMTNIKDWCISRQLWWGHRIPAWYCDDCAAVVVSAQTPTACKCGSSSLTQDEDVLDTWFSSALWPFSTLGWPEKTASLARFYPNDVLVTGPDIIFFWVARMMMMGLHFMGDVPFRTVYLTPIVTDESGEKMSKVKGNVIDPLVVVNGATFDELIADAADHPAATKYIEANLPEGISSAGADALRFSLAAMTMPGRNMRLSMERVEGYRKFVNKLWNASRFCLMNVSGSDGFDADQFERAISDGTVSADLSLSLADRWIFSRFQRVAAAVDEALEAFRFADAANALYHFVWHELCDWYIELAKASLYSEDAKIKFAAQGTLTTVLERSLRLLHPFMPHVTEEIWQKLPRPAEVCQSLMITFYPAAEMSFVDEEAEATMPLLMDVAGSIRSIRSGYNVKPSKEVDVELRVADDGKRSMLETHRELVERIARVKLTIAVSGEDVPQSATGVVGADIEVVIPLAGLIDIDEERKRIDKELAKSDKEIGGITKKLANEKFVAKAPAEVVEENRRRLTEESERREKLLEARASLDSLSSPGA